jgi:hypothetical protein
MKHATLPLVASLTCALCLGGSSRAHAGIIYQTGFENPPFTLGPIAGQDGWNVFSGGSTPNAATIQNAVFFAGSQAVEVNTAQASGQTGPWRSDPSSPSDQIVTMKAEVMLTSSSVPTAWQFAGLTGSLGTFFGGFNALTDGTLQIITTGFPVTTSSVVSRDVWNLWEVDYNFTTQTFNILINNSLVAANEPFLNPATAFGTGLFDTFNATGGNDIGYLDNYSITGAVIPEPGGLVLLGTSSLFMLGFAKLKSCRARYKAKL